MTDQTSVTAVQMIQLFCLAKSYERDATFSVVGDEPWLTIWTPWDYEPGTTYSRGKSGDILRLTSSQEKYQEMREELKTYREAQDEKARAQRVLARQTYDDLSVEQRNALGLFRRP